MSLSSSQKQQITQLLESSLIELKEQLALSSESSKTVQLDQSMIGRASRIDAIQQQKIAQAAFERDKLHFYQLTKALKNINTEDFGYCVECDEAISFSRLMIKPESTFCVTCQQNMEAN